MNLSREGIDQVRLGPKCRYSSPLREEQRRATRTRVIDAAGTAFAERGYVATTMRAIADVAGVSVDTVYLNGSKRELLFAALEKLTVGDEGSHSALERPWIQEPLAEPDLRRLLAALVSVIAGAHRRTVGIFTALVVGATADEEYRGLVDGMRADSKVLASLFDERRGAHSGVPLKDLADTFWVRPTSTDTDTSSRRRAGAPSATPPGSRRC